MVPSAVVALDGSRRVVVDRSWWLVALGGVLVVGGGVAAVMAPWGEDEAEEGGAQFVVSGAEASEARASAGCEQLEVPDLAPTPHLDTLEDAPPPEELYPDLRPTAGGRHLGARVHAVGVVDAPPDERVTTHNLEHGAVVVYYDADTLADEAIDVLGRWGSGWNDAGFDEAGEAGAGVIVAPYRGEFTSGKPLALRAWGVALDCDEFSVPVADAFLAEHFGDRGTGPERHLAPYPDDVLELVP